MQGDERVMRVRCAYAWKAQHRKTAPVASGPFLRLGWAHVVVAVVLVLLGMADF
jgi:hypothetical protein